MLDAAERLEDPDRPAMGIGRHAVALNNRGAALAMLGRLGEADRVLAAAAAAEPLLSEANTSRAATTVCSHGPEAAAKFLRAGRHRQPQKPLDSSRGKATELRKLELPGVPKEAAQMRTFFQNQSTKLQGETTAQIDRANQLEANDPRQARRVDARAGPPLQRDARPHLRRRRGGRHPRASTRPSTPSSTRSSSSSAASGATTSARTTSTRSWPTPRASGAPAARSRTASRSA